MAGGGYFLLPSRGRGAGFFSLARGGGGRPVERGPLTGARGSLWLTRATQLFSQRPAGPRGNCSLVFSYFTECVCGRRLGQGGPMMYSSFQRRTNPSLGAGLQGGYDAPFQYFSAN